MRKPNLFIVGAPKCGTTSMSGYLDQHPDIFFSHGWKKKEPYFFCSDFSSHKWRISNPDQYLSIFDGASSEKHVGEASPWYLYSKIAAYEIKRYEPSAKIIIMLRNPVDMMYSLHRQFLYSTNEDRADFESALTAEEDRKCGRCIPESAYFPEGLFYRDVARYAEQVRRYIDTFGRQSVHVIIFDDLKADVSKVYREALEFLEVDPGFHASLGVSNAAKTVRSAWVQRLLFHPPSILRKMYYCLPARLGEPVSRTVLDFLKALNVRSGYDGAMNDALRAQLQREFTPDVQRLSELLGRDLTYWCSPTNEKMKGHAP